MKNYNIDIYNLMMDKVLPHISGGIYSHNLPPNPNFNDPVLVIENDLFENITTLDGNEPELQIYNTRLTILSKSTETNAIILDEIEKVINTYEDHNIREIVYTGTTSNSNLEEGIYIKTINLTVTYSD
ncbi:MAG: hypothetical protein ACOCRK_02730 [bacterium]